MIWKTKDGREIPVEELDDQHLLSILRMLRRTAIFANAARSLWYAVAPVGSLGDAARMAFDAEADRQMETTWRGVVAPQWENLLSEALDRTEIAEAAGKLASDDCMLQQIAAELTLVSKKLSIAA